MISISISGRLFSNVNLIYSFYLKIFTTAHPLITLATLNIICRRIMSEKPQKYFPQFPIMLSESDLTQQQSTWYRQTINWLSSEESTRNSQNILGLIYHNLPDSSIRHHSVKKWKMKMHFGSFSTSSFSYEKMIIKNQSRIFSILTHSPFAPKNIYALSSSSSRLLIDTVFHSRWKIFESFVGGYKSRK